MICPQCQCENLPDSVFCDHCGARLETVCSRCGEPNRREARFCRICGQTINHTATTAPSISPAVPSPETYVPKHIADKILASRQAIESKRKHITVLFADVRATQKMLDRLNQEDGQKLIDTVM